ncbi:Uncharacterised protein [uncultured archaeon]|nr:Uncharacterised protein [uncultured archaeon]
MMDMARNYRGQAAMEYLVTYGWALLALFIVVAFLVSSDIFSPNSFVTQECTFQPDLPCPSSILYQNGSFTTLRFSIVNGMGFKINVTNATYTATNMGLQGRQVYSDPITNMNGVQSGRYMNFSHTFTGTQIQPQPRESRQVLVSITYYNCKNTPCTGPYTTSGRVSAFVERQ